MQRGIYKARVAQDIYVYVDKGANHHYVYVVECTSNCSLHFTISLEGSVNFVFKNSPSQKKKHEVLVHPYSRTSVAEVELVVGSQRAILNVEYFWKRIETDKEILERVIQSNELELFASIKEAALIYVGRNLNSKKVGQIFRSNKICFIDSSFPPLATSLYDFDASVVNSPPRSKICWKRPSQYMHTQSYSVFNGHVEPDDIRAGSLDDWWLLSALASLAEFPHSILVRIQ